MYDTAFRYLAASNTAMAWAKVNEQLYPIVLACLLWGHQWSGKELLFHCDNQAVVDIWASGTSLDPLIMHLVRSIFFSTAINHYTVLVAHIVGTNNSGKLPFLGKSRHQWTAYDSIQKTDTYRQITWRIILQPNFTQSHDYKDSDKTSTTSLRHTRQLTRQKQIPWTCFSQKQLQRWLY